MYQKTLIEGRVKKKLRQNTKVIYRLSFGLKAFAYSFSTKSALKFKIYLTFATNFSDCTIVIFHDSPRVYLVMIPIEKALILGNIWANEFEGIFKLLSTRYLQKLRSGIIIRLSGVQIPPQPQFY